MWDCQCNGPQVLILDNPQVWIYKYEGCLDRIRSQQCSAKGMDVDSNVVRFRINENVCDQLVRKIGRW